MPFRTVRPEYKLSWNQKVLGKLLREGSTQESCLAVMTTDHAKDRDPKISLKAQ